MNYRELFSKTPAVKLFFLAAIPGSVGMLASALYQTIDGVLVGRILAGDAFAALNLAMPLVIINFFACGSDRRGICRADFGSAGAKKRRRKPTAYLYSRCSTECAIPCSRPWATTGAPET